mgnify:CR=1 FL=1
MISIERRIDGEVKKINTTPTDQQKEAGNYRKAHVTVNGFKITIENPKGSRRYYNGDKYNVMKNHYGYFNGSVGYDGDQVDVFLGDYLDSDKIFVVDQRKPGGGFDESKVMMGFRTEKDAKDAYMSNYDKDWKGFMAITEVSVDDFKKWLHARKKQRKAFSEYKKLYEGMKKKVIKLNESDIREVIANSVRRALKESYEDGPTNDPEGFDEVVYYKAVEIMRKFGYDDVKGFVRDKEVDALEYVMDTYMDYYANDEKIRDMDADTVAKLMAREAMKIIDADYYEEEVEPVMEGRVVKMNESQVRNIIRNCVKRVLKENYEPAQADWDDFGEWASSDEPDLWQDEMGAEHDKTQPDDGILIDADDECEGYSRDYMEGQEYGKNLLAKSKNIDSIKAELMRLEEEGTISAYEQGILDTIAEDGV